MSSTWSNTSGTSAQNLGLTGTVSIGSNTFSIGNGIVTGMCLSGNTLSINGGTLGGGGPYQTQMPLPYATKEDLEPIGKLLAMLFVEIQELKAICKKEEG